MIDELSEWCGAKFACQELPFFRHIGKSEEYDYNGC